MTFNPWIGCTKVSPGCANCYAEELMDKRYGRVNWGKGNPRSRTSETYWNEPLRWNRKAEKQINQQTRVFCASLSDWLDPEVPIEWLAHLLDLIRQTPHLDWLLLTKRPELWRGRLEACWDNVHLGNGQCPSSDWLADWLDGNPPRNVWIGTSIEDRKRADERIPALLKIPAKVRFLSCEPLLGAVDLTRPFATTSSRGNANGVTGYSCPLHWVIVGGESGNNARPMEVGWARSLRDQCNAAGIAFFMKQMGGSRDKRGELSDLPEDLRIREFPEVQSYE